jgi:hypothetical protein
VPRLKKEYSYTSTPPLAFVVFYRGNFTFNFTISVCPYAWNKMAPTGWIVVKYDI